MSKKSPQLRFEGFTDDWEERKLIDVKDNEDRYSYTGGPFGSDLKSSDYTEIGVRIIQLQNIGDGKFVNDYKIYTSEEKARSLNSNLIYPGEIIIAKMADPLARATILPKIEPKYLMASDGIRLKINTDYFDNYYILTQINSDVFRKEALNNSTGTTRKRIGLVTLGNLPMMIPSFEEQQKIGSLFKQLDDTIVLHQRKLDLLKEQKKGYLQKMFPKNGAKVPELRFAGFAEDWEERKLRDLLNKNSEKNKNLSVINVESVSNKTGFTKQTDQFEDYSVASADLSNYYVIREKQFAYNPSRINVGSIAYKDLGDEISVVSPLYVSFSTKKVLNDGFLWNWFKTASFDAQRQRLSEGGVRDTLSFNQLSEMNTMFPTYPEQEKIGSFFQQLDETIALHQRKLDLLKEQKKGFLQKMFV